MRTPRSLIMLILVAAATPAGTAWGARSIFKLYNFQHFLETSYTFEDSYSKTGGQEDDRGRHATKELYVMDLNYAVLTQRLWRGSIRLGLEGQQDFQKGEDGGNVQEMRYNYDVTGIIFRREPYPLSFNVGSSTQRVSPAFSRSYDVETDQQGVAFTLKNLFLPATISYDRSVFETSGQAEDYRDSINSFGVSLSHATSDRFSTTTASLRNNHGTSESLTTGARQDHYAVSGNISNLLQPSLESGLSRTLSTSYTWHGDDGSNKGKSAVLKETVDWELGRVLNLKLDGEMESSTSGQQSRDRKEGKAELEHRLLETVTTKIRGKTTDLEVNTGTEKMTSGGVGIEYMRLLPQNSNFSLEYVYDHTVSDSRTGTDTIFYRDERMNAGAVETDNYLARTDVVTSTLVVWNAGRTRTFIEGLDYTPVQDGRRTRLRIEPGGAIRFGDPLSIDYDVRVNPQLKFETDTHAVASVVNLWRIWTLSANWSQSEQQKVSGRDDVAPLGPQRFVAARVERLAPLYRAGLEYTDVSTVALKYRKMVGFWRYNREFEKSAVTAGVSQTVQKHEETVSAGSVSPGGTSNRFMSNALYRRQVNENLSFVVSGQFENAWGRSTDQQLLSSWLKGTYRAGSMELELNTKVDWRFYNSQYERNFITKLDFKRYF